MALTMRHCAAWTPLDTTAADIACTLGERLRPDATGRNWEINKRKGGTHAGQ